MGKKSRKKRERQKSQKEVAVSRQDNFLEKTYVNIIIGLACLAFITPLVLNFKFFFPFVSSKSLYFFAIVEILLAVYIVLAIYSPRYRPRFNLLLLSLVLFVAILVLASITGIDPSKSFWSYYERMEGLLAWFHYLVFFIVLTSVLKRKKDWMIVLGFSVGVAALISIISFILKSGDFQVTNVARSGATLGNSSFLGAYLLFNVFLALWLLIKSKEGWKIVWGSFLLIIGVALFISTARAAALSFVGGLFLLFLLWLTFQPAKKYLRMIGLIIILSSIVASLILVFWALQPDSFVHQQLAQKFTNARFVVWEIGWKGWQDRPWLGWGLENFSAPFAKHYNPCLALRECGGETWFDRAHNIVVDMGITSGLLGLISYLGIFIVSFYLLAKKYFQKGKFWAPAILVVILVSYFIQNLTVFDMVSSYMMFFGVLAFISFQTKKEEPISRKEPSFSIGKKVLIVVLILFIAFSFFKVIIQPVRASVSFVTCLVDTRIGFNQRMEYCQRALEFTSLGKNQLRDYFGGVVIRAVGTLQSEGITANDFQKVFEAMAEELEKSVKNNSFDLRSRLKLAQLYNAYPLADREKYFSRTEEVLQEAIRISPDNQRGYQTLIHTKLLWNKQLEALDLAKKVVYLEPRISRSHLILAETAYFAQDYDLAKKSMETVEEMGFPYWNNFAVLRRYADIFGYFNQYDKVIAAFQKALSETHPDNKAQRAQLHRELGSIYLKIGQEEEAHKQLYEANNLEPPLTP